MTADVVTRFVTGNLVATLIAAAVLTWPVCWVLLGLYRRAVRRSMNLGTDRPVDSGRTDRRDPAGAAQPDAETPSRALTPLGTFDGGAPPDESAQLLRDLRARPWSAGYVYIAAGLAYAATITLVTVWFEDPGAPVGLVRFLSLTTVFAWPLVPTLAMVAGAVRRQRIVIGAVYAAAYVAVMTLAVAISPKTSLWQLVHLWTLYNLPPTALVALSLSRRIRAIGPLVLLFLIVGLLGAEVLIEIVGSSQWLLRLSVTAGGWFGLGGVATFFGVAMAGFGACAAIGCALLLWITRRYKQKRTSDESLTIASVWWLYVFGYSIELAFEHPLAPLSGVVAMAVFISMTRLGFMRAAPGAGRDFKLLLLRSFSIGARSEQLFDALEKHWRRVGSIQMIAGYDLATRTIEPHEFLDFVAGKLSRRFIDSAAALERRLQEMDARPDRDGRFRVNDFFCHNDTWRDALSALARDADAVLMDLRGFSRRNAGCVFEIGELFRLVPLARIVFVVDAGTDVAFLRETFDHAAVGAMSAAMPGTPRLLTCAALDVATFRELLSALAAATNATIGDPA